MTSGTTDHDDLEIRQYLLGELEGEPAVALERDYFAREELFDRVWAAENDLVDEYLAGRLSAHERDRFEHHYLASPAHRDRVAAARELRSHGASVASPEPAAHAWWTTMRSPAAWTALAAALVVIAVGGVWMVRSPSRVQPPLEVRAPEPSQPQQPLNATASAPVRAPVTIALTLSAITLRGTDEPASLTIPDGTDVVVLHLEGDRSAPRFDRGRAVVRTLAGGEVWRGPAVSDGAPPALARVELPAGTLAPDDYIVALLETAAGGTDTERYRYFLRVRPR